MDVVSTWFDRETNDSIHVYNHDDSFQALLGFLPVEEIEQKYGGKKINIKYFYPPINWILSKKLTKNWNADVEA